MEDKDVEETRVMAVLDDDSIAAERDRRDAAQVTKKKVKKVKKKKANQLKLADNFRAAFSRSSTVSALRTRKIPAEYVKFPHIHQYLVRGKYANDLMRMDDFINDLVTSDEMATKRSVVPFSKRRVLNKSYARNFQLLQECVLHAHIAVEDRRLIEQSIQHDTKIDLLTHFRSGNTFWSSDNPQEGVSARFTVIYDDGALYESFLYISNGTIYVTQLRVVETEYQPEDVDTREWPDLNEMDSSSFVTLDETYTRFAGAYLISRKGDSMEGRFWINTADTPRDFEERLAPDPEEGTTEQIMEHVSLRSLFVANYGALEAVALSFFFVFIASVAWKPGVWWTILPLALGAATFALMAVILRKILDTTLTADIMVAKQKPDLKLWKYSQYVRALLAIVATLVMMVGAAMLTLRVEDKNIEDFSLATMTGLFPAATAVGIAAWHISARRVRVPINMLPITDSMSRHATTVDMFIAAVLAISGLSLYLQADDQNWTHMIAFIVFALVMFPLITWMFSALIGGLTPLRTLERSRCTKYVHNDSGLSRQQWSEKYKMVP